MLFDTWGNALEFLLVLAAVGLVLLFMDKTKELDPLRNFFVRTAPFAVFVGSLTWMVLLWQSAKPLLHYLLPMLPTLICLYVICRRRA